MDGQGGPRGCQVRLADSCFPSAESSSHGWRWVDRSSWSIEEETENVRKTIAGQSFLIFRQSAGH
jgi:hypothetical protein